MIDVFSIVFALVVIILTRKDIRFGLAGFILVSIFPNVQGREILGVTGFNAMNLIFFAIVLKYYLPRFTNKVGSGARKGTIITPLILILVFTQLIFVLRYLFELKFIGVMTVLNAFNTFLLKPLEYYSVLHILFNTIKTIKEIKSFFYILFVATFIGAVVLFWQFVFLGVSGEALWFNDFAGHKNTFGVKIGLFTIISVIFYFYSNEKKMKILSFVGIVLGGGVLIYSLSRTAWIIFLIAMVFLIYKARLKKLFLLFPVVFIIFTTTPLFDMVVDRMIRENAKENTSTLNKITAGRVEKKWKPQIEGIIENPLLGGGTIGLLGHSGYLSTWNQIGLLGLIISIFIYVKIYLTTGKINDSLPNKPNLAKAFTLTGLALVITVPFVNITGSLQFFRNDDLPSIFLILFFFQANLRLKEILINNYVSTVYKKSEKKELLTTTT